MLQTLNAMLALFDQPRYLEIGLGEGLSFHGVQATLRVGVDPQPAFDVDAARLSHPEAIYHKTTSDVFFGNYSGPLFDVVYIDGLHTSEQTLRDLINVLSVTRDNSIIIIDDVGPNSYASSLPRMEDTHRLKIMLGDPDLAWMGDVYRLVYFIDTFMQRYTYASPIGGNPQLVMWRQTRASTQERTLQQVGCVDFMSFMMEQDILRKAPLEEIVARAKQAGAGDGDRAPSAAEQA